MQSSVEERERCFEIVDRLWHRHDKGQLMMLANWGRLEALKKLAKEID
jgi:hypothetical protein